MVRFSSGAMGTAAAMILIEGLTKKTYPLFEDIDGRKYVNIEKAAAADLALLLLYGSYPQRMNRQALTDAIRRYGPKAAAASMAVRRLRTLTDDKDGDLKLRGLGRKKAEDSIRRLGQKVSSEQ